MSNTCQQHFIFNSSISIWNENIVSNQSFFKKKNVEMKTSNVTIRSVETKKSHIKPAWKSHNHRFAVLDRLLWIQAASTNIINIKTRIKCTSINSNSNAIVRRNPLWMCLLRCLLFTQSFYIPFSISFSIQWKKDKNTHDICCDCLEVEFHSTISNAKRAKWEVGERKRWKRNYDYTMEYQWISTALILL